ncbi:effector-associated constant component EACC1 [Streptomyces griseus]|uniref:effector-associated constant component EACC1 n=1 Tax=Streptomyces griseus TaxID=1911 RepID=UPI0033B6DB41
MLADGDELGLKSLTLWLREDTGTARLEVVPVSPATSSTMSVLDAVDIVLSNGIAITNFAVAYATWRDARAHRPGTGAGTLVHGESTVDISHLSAEELAGLLTRLHGEENEGGEE